MATSCGPTILITRLSHLGDCVLTLPMANALRDAMPTARILWIVEPPSDQILRDHSAIDEVIVLDKHWRRSVGGIAATRSRMLALRPDIVLDPQSLTKSAVLGWWTNAPRRIGMAMPWGRELAPWLHRELVTTGTVHLVDRTMALLQPLGIQSREARFDLPRNEQAESFASSMSKSLHLPKRFVVVNPGAGWPTKLWPESSFARVARHLGQYHQIPSLVTWAGTREQELANSIVRSSGGYAILAPRTDVNQLVAILRRATMFLGSDTGPMHLAAAVGTPCVALFGPTRAEVSGPYGRSHICLHGDSGLHRKRTRKRGPNLAMRTIDADRVIEACVALCQRPGSTSNLAVA